MSALGSGVIGSGLIGRGTRPAPPDSLDVPTKLILEGADARLGLEGVASSLALAEGVTTTLRLGTTNAGLTAADSCAALALAPPETTVVLDDRAEELILDG
jgi:hypothetical protein